MQGCRPLSASEITLISDHLPSERDRVLFLLGIYTGFRIQELLTIRRSQILDLQGSVLTRLSVRRGNMKGKNSSRSVILHPNIIPRLHAYTSNLTQDALLFPIGRMQAWRILNAVVTKLEAQGKFRRDGVVATHSMRKTFAAKVYKNSGKDLVLTSKALGHKLINNTALYLSFAQTEIDKAILDD